MRKPEPIGAWLRGTRAQRRVGREAACACGETRPYALIPGRIPPLCYGCERLAHGREPYEENHVFGKRNGTLTIRYPVNDHRAVFSVKQLDWTDETLENPHGSPLLEGAARFHGLHDNITHMLVDCMTMTAKFEHVEDLLRTKYGPDWLPKLEADAARSTRKAAKARRKP